MEPDCVKRSREMDTTPHCALSRLWSALKISAVEPTEVLRDARTRLGFDLDDLESLRAKTRKLAEAVKEASGALENVYFDEAACDFQESDAWKKVDTLAREFLND